MRIIGVDCGAEKTGYGVIDTDGSRHQLVTAGIVRTKTAEAFEKRLSVIADGLSDILGEFQPEVMAVEEVFHAINTKSALKLAHVRGVAFLVAAQAGLAVTEYSPLSVKMSVVGYGRAEKQQVQMMVLSLLGVSQKFESFDATDALAVAICHGTQSNHLLLAGTRA
ncbi:MAG TPA: crossover junction endodeoxyribonuclease RuvC [Bryobacteraceae bacterium]|jgi:crossover junction endodeoxyribonuclease RuvC|nr:crossover junction endodeoxyribonuclease RuvC [Bryobacteraceae bacterium]